MVTTSCASFVGRRVFRLLALGRCLGIGSVTKTLERSFGPGCVRIALRSFNLIGRLALAGLLISIVEDHERPG